MSTETTPSKFPSDIEISRAAKLKPIALIAQKIGIDPEDIIPYGKYKAKVPLSFINEEKIKKSNLILVTAVTPTKAGVGKTVTSVALSLGLNHIGKSAAVALREPRNTACIADVQEAFRCQGDTTRDALGTFGSAVPPSLPILKKPLYEYHRAAPATHEWSEARAPCRIR